MSAVSCSPYTMVNTIKQDYAQYMWEQMSANTPLEVYSQLLIWEALGALWLQIENLPFLQWGTLLDNLLGTKTLPKSPPLSTFRQWVCHPNRSQNTSNFQRTQMEHFFPEEWGGSPFVPGFLIHGSKASISGKEDICGAGGWIQSLQQREVQERRYSLQDQSQVLALFHMLIKLQVGLDEGSQGVLPSTIIVQGQCFSSQL